MGLRGRKFAFWKKGDFNLEGQVEVDEIKIGGLEKNKYSMDKLKAGRGTIGKNVVVGAKYRDTKKLVPKWLILPTKNPYMG